MGLSAKMTCKIHLLHQLHPNNAPKVKEKQDKAHVTGLLAALTVKMPFWIPETCMASSTVHVKHLLMKGGAFRKSKVKRKMHLTWRPDANLSHQAENLHSTHLLHLQPAQLFIIKH